MENKKEGCAVKKRRISKGKVVAAAAFAVVFLSLGSYVCFSGESRNSLKQNGALAIKSFEEVFAPPTSDGIVSEIDPVSQNASSGTDEASGNTSSTVADAAENDGRSVPPQIAKVSNATVTESSVVTAPPPDVPDSNVNIENNTSSPSVATESGPGPSCDFPVSDPSVISHHLILNEVAWMGSPALPGETADHAANREWMELKNISGAEVSLEGWLIADVGGKIKISFGSGDMLAANGFYLLSRGGALNGIAADKAYTGTLSNAGDKLIVLDSSCGVSDFLDASAKWPGGSNATKQTLERTTDFGWQTSASSGGTPRAENSTGAAPLAASTATGTYELDVAIAGDGGGKVTIKPGGVVCGTTCTGEYVAGTAMLLAAAPGMGATFVGWSGGCSGTSACSFSVGGPVSVVAEFRLNADASLMDQESADVLGADSGMPSDISAGNDSSSTNSVNASSTDLPPPPPPSTASIDHLVIAAVQIAGAASSDDFVKIYNPTAAAVDMSGWKLRKKSSTGTDASLREFPAGSSVAAGAYFTWASSANGFAQSIGADASSTGTLAANNSVALFDGSGAQVDAVAWGTGTGQYGEGAPYPDDPLPNQVLQRKFLDGAAVDTDNNENDFTL